MRLYDTDKDGNRFLVPSKFYQDANGDYWECRAVIGGRKLLVPAPPWAGNINPYIFEGPNIFVEAASKPLCDVPELRLGATPCDDGNLILTDEEKNELLRTDPLAEKFIRPYMMGKDFINRITRWCLWMVGAEPADIRKCPHVLERIERVRKFRLASKRKITKKCAETPMLFTEVRYSNADYLAIPKVSSEKRRYIPIGWLSTDVIAGDKIFFCENSTLYQFGVLMSSVYMAWVRIVSGRLKSDYSYSSTIDYNCFPWPEIPETHPQHLAIEKTAQAILDARALYPRSSLADLYDERTMPPELRKAHNANDEAVMTAYGFKRHYEDDRFHDEDIATNLLYMYKELTGCEEFTDNYPNLH
ncbi:MAG: class I SAM-dependent DNA methyltransferase [Synergistaceae bacterium]|nr:class I SAM-dependent DNA methyltransferase [Synergistaceae bacterium]